MMNYEIFKEVIKEKVAEKMPKAGVIIQSTQKVNRVLDGLIIKTESPVSLTIYLNEFYDRYKETENIEEIVESILTLYGEGIKTMPNVNINFNSKKVVCQVINAAANERLLLDVPHVKWNDLAVVFRLIVSDEGKGVQSALIRFPLMERIGVMSSEELYQIARNNTKEIMPAKIRNMTEIISEAMGIPAGMIPEPDFPMYVVVNEKNMWGANAILFPEIFRDLAEKMENDLFILPSSIHELIAVPASEMDAEGLKEMVSQVNGSEVSEEERLSNSVYYYSRETGQITVSSSDKSIIDM